MKGAENPAAAGLDVLLGALAGQLAEPVAELVVERLAVVLAERPAPRLLDRRGLAALLDVSLPTVDRLRAEGCPELRVADAPRFEAERVLEWLRGRA
ncbi:MAG: hypothetical protein QM756_10625 [Polyangiaceae bacterium]